MILSFGSPVWSCCRSDSPRGQVARRRPEELLLHHLRQGGACQAVGLQGHHHFEGASTCRQQGDAKGWRTGWFYGTRSRQRRRLWFSPYGGSFPGYGGASYPPPAYPASGYVDPYAYGSYSYGAPDYGTAQGGYFTSAYSGRPSPGKMMRGRGARGRPY